MQQWLAVVQTTGALLAFAPGVTNLITAIVGRRRRSGRRRTR
jgi:hypothetical protein